MSLLTTTGSAILTPEQVMDVVIRPLTRTAVCARASTVVHTSSNTARFPVVDTDATTSWTPEGTAIDVSEPVLPEVEVVPKGLKGLVVTSNELWDDADASTQVLDVVGNGLVRDLQTRLDAAYFGTTTTNGPSGLGNLGDTQQTDMAWDETLDVFADALSKAEQAGVAAVGADGKPNMTFVLSSGDTLQVMTAKTATDSAQPLLGPDATQATGRSILGVPLLSSKAVTDGAGWLIPKDRVFLVLRNDPQVVADRSAYFGSDSTGIRCVLRAGFGFVHEEAVIQVDMGGGS